MLFLLCNDLPLSKIGDSAARIRCKEEDRPARPVVITGHPTETLGDMGLRVVCGERPGAEVRWRGYGSCCVVGVKHELFADGQGVAAPLFG